ncbi:MAG TPA: hypothetical protein VMW22_08960 [Candidatus Desulfaltia sp.]|nr:hypothetical protein [Candidatus Desulfaltia sp.]
MSGQNIFDKLQNIDRRVFYWVLFITLMVPFIMPIGLPVKVVKNTRDLYEGVTGDNINPGDIAIMNFGYGVSAWSECAPGFTVCAKALLREGARIVFMGAHYDVELSYNKLRSEAAEDFATKQYGVDYVFLGYFAGGESAIAQLATDSWTVYPEDHYRTPVSEIPLMQDFHGWQDVAVVLSSDTGDVGSYFLRQWQGAHGTKLAEIGIAMNGSTDYPYYLAGNYFGLSIGSRGGAELEVLIGEPGEATTAMDSINASHILIVLAVILANVGYLVQRRQA